jgi:hypothetical protein
MHISRKKKMWEKEKRSEWYENEWRYIEFWIDKERQKKFEFEIWWDIGRSENMSHVYLIVNWIIPFQLIEAVLHLAQFKKWFLLSQNKKWLGWLSYMTHFIVFLVQLLYI